MKKYKLTDDTIGYIEKEEILNHDADCWACINAKVCGNARVYDDAKVFGYAEIYDNAKVGENMHVK